MSSIQRESFVLPQNKIKYYFLAKWKSIFHACNMSNTTASMLKAYKYTREPACHKML